MFELGFGLCYKGLLKPWAAHFIYSYNKILKLSPPLQLSQIKRQPQQTFHHSGNKIKGGCLMSYD